MGDTSITAAPAAQTPIGQAAIQYPHTRKGETVDRYFSTPVSDPYRWLEDDTSAETGAWVAAQNEVTSSYLKHIPFRDPLKKRMEQLWNIETVGAPFTEGAHTYFFKNQGLQNHDVLYRKVDEIHDEVFLDPNTFSEDGSTSLDCVAFSVDGTKVAYTLSENGSDWRTVLVIDALTKAVLEEALVNVKFSGVSWRGNEGFYYSSYDKPGSSVLSQVTDQHTLYFHLLGTDQKDDEVIFGQDKKRLYVGGYVTEDQQYLVISASESTYGNELYIQSLAVEGSPLVTVVDNFDAESGVIESVHGTLFICTDLNAPNRRVVSVAASNPGPENWVDLIEETRDVLEVSLGGGYIFALYMKDAASFVRQYSYAGELVREVELPALGTVGGFGGKHSESVLYYVFTNYIDPGALYAYDVKTGQSMLYKRYSIDFNSEAYESKQVFCASKDGTKIPVVISYRKGLVLDGKNPTILYGYGSFNVSLVPVFSVASAVWMENGGVYAVANIRGGGEYGRAWYEAGIQLNKQNGFDDFIAAGEYLIAEHFTSSGFLAIQGGSNGGLLVGAVMTQRPDLMKVALPAVGVLDMLRYHVFTAGAGWANDYGTAEDSEEMFEYLHRYSPLHNVKEGVQYPATLITTADHDDRVVPAHSFKFAAELQAKQTGGAPVLLRVDVNAGHGEGKSLAASIQEEADTLAFALYSMGVNALPAPQRDE